MKEEIPFVIIFRKFLGYDIYSFDQFGIINSRYIAFL